MAYSSSSSSSTSQPSRPSMNYYEIACVFVAAGSERAIDTRHDLCAFGIRSYVYVRYAATTVVAAQIIIIIIV